MQESQKTPAFRPLSDGIVPKMKNLVTSVFQSSAYPTKHTAYDNTPSHSQYNAQYNIKQNVEANQANVKVAPQQASVGSLVNYLEYIRGLQKTKTGADKGQKVLEKGEAGKVKNAVYVTPAPQVNGKVIKQQHAEPNAHESQNQAAPEVPGNQNQVSPEVLKQETALLEQQLQQLASLQNFQQQLQLIHPYAAEGYQPVQVQGPVQGQQHLPNQIQAGQLDAQNYPVVLDLPGNMDLSSLFTQYQIVPDVPRDIQQVPIVNSQSQPQQYLEDPMVEAESSNIPTFLIHVPDEDEVEEDRSLRPTFKPKSKRHLRPLQVSPTSQRPVSKVKKLSQLQQVQLMQQQLYHLQPQANNKKTTKQTKRSPTFDVVRSISFEIDPNGAIIANN